MAVLGKLVTELSKEESRPSNGWADNHAFLYSSSEKGGWTSAGSLMLDAGGLVVS